LGSLRQKGKGLVLNGKLQASQPFLGILQGLLEQGGKLVCFKLLQAQTRQRESRGAITSKEGFSVVAPMMVTSPFSTAAERHPAGPC
jgi:hypothetical protein